MNDRNTADASGKRSGPLILGGLLLCLLVVVSHIPLLPLGFGVDDDAWFMAAAAGHLAETGGYTISRVPGYPAAELWYALAFHLFDASPTVGNSAATVMGLLAVLVLILILRGTRIPLWLLFLSAATLAFHPAFWIASTSTLDFVLSSALITALVLALFDNAPVTAGVILGLATGARITNALAWIPAVLFLTLGRHNRKGALTFSLGGAATSLLLLALPFSKLGFAFLQYDSALHPDYVIGLYKVYSELIGLPVVLVVCSLALLKAWLQRHDDHRPFPAFKEAVRDARILLVAGIGGVLTVPFLLLPTDPFYLLPLVPLTIILLVLLTEKNLIGRSSLAAILIASMTLSFVSVGEVDVSSWRRARRIRIHGFLPGRVLQDLAQRREILRRAATAAYEKLPAHSIVILGRPFLPWLYLRGTPVSRLGTESTVVQPSDTLVVRILRPALLDRERSRRIYYASGEDLPYLTQRILGYSLQDIGGTELPLW